MPGRWLGCFRHARPCAGHPRLAFLFETKTWTAGSRASGSDAVLRTAMPGRDGGGEEVPVNSGGKAHYLRNFGRAPYIDDRLAPTQAHSESYAVYARIP